MEIHLRTAGCRLPYVITVLPATRHKRTHHALTPASEGWHSIYLPRKAGRLSWPWWLITCPGLCHYCPLSTHLKIGWIIIGHHKNLC